MTAAVNPRTQAWFPWFMLLLGLIIGFFADRAIQTKQQIVTGNCINPRDSSVVASGVSQQSCQTSCPTCIWQRGSQ
ncbi:MAG TPA: hypothetical protein VGP80_07900 [Gemmatimonadales bacterium]|nr:hypothetical protein [Gemmatimonadales bacterium]